MNHLPVTCSQLPVVGTETLHAPVTPLKITALCLDSVFSAPLRFNFRFQVCTVFIAALCLMIFSACVPAHVPDNLDDTPGPPVVISDGWYRGIDFSARVPAGWRIITSEAAAPQAVIFAAPDNVAIIRLISGQVREADVITSGQRNAVDEIKLVDGHIITSVLSAPQDQWATFEPVYEQVRQSVKPSPPSG